jgi:hypothetical protein
LVVLRDRVEPNLNLPYEFSDHSSRFWTSGVLQESNQPTFGLLWTSLSILAEFNLRSMQTFFKNFQMSIRKIRRVGPHAINTQPKSAIE